MVALAYTATWLGALPFLWLVGRYVRGHPVRPDAWWIASGFGVSCVADLLVRIHWLAPWVASPVYLVSQGAFIATALAPDVWAVLVTLVAVGEVQVLFAGVTRPDVLLHTVAFGTITGAALMRPTRYRWSLLAAFGVGLLAWWAYVAAPGWATWLAYQGCRAVAVALFCMATE